MSKRATRVAVVGGGLAGLAAAAALAERGLDVELFEARRQLGGRAGSFCDPATQQLIDHCQHVGMGCCTNLIDFWRRTGIAHLHRIDRVLNFFGPDGRHYRLQAARGLPAPLHLLPSFMRLGYLSAAERLAVVRAVMQLARIAPSLGPDQPTVGQWLRQRGQSPRAIEWFWGVVLVSALSESLDRAALSAARKVMVDAFLAHRQAYQLYLPTVPLGQLYGHHVAGWLQRHGAVVHLGRPVVGLDIQQQRATALQLADGSRQQFDWFVLAVPWRRVGRLLPRPALAGRLERIEQIESAPITSAHLWFDRPITTLPHAVLVGRLSQWLFRRPVQPDQGANSHYCQVVISASRELAGEAQQRLVEQIVRELAATWPAARQARLQSWRLVTQREAVFSTTPAAETARPPQQTAIANLWLAGDWTATGWPSTMESAVRSGYLAAEQLLAAAGRPQHVLQPDLPRSRWLRWLAGAAA